MPARDTPSFDAAVVIGRFQPFHDGTAWVLSQAAASSDTVVVVLGSAFAARSTKHPFTWQERAQMIRLAAGDAAPRLEFLPVRDYPDDARWVAEVRAGVERLVPGATKVALYGHDRDATTYYLQRFPDWYLIDVGGRPSAQASALRRALFSGASTEAVLASLAGQVPAAVLDYLRAWAELPFLDQLTRSWATIRAERERWAGAPYPPIFVTVDAVVRCADHVLLVRRGREPGAGLLALPGGFVETDERLFQAACRELVEETGIGVLQSTLERAFRSAHVFDHPQRSVRGRTITHAHFFDLGQAGLPQLTAGDDAAEAHWVAVADLPKLETDCFEDHFSILDHFLGLTGPEAPR